MPNLKVSKPNKIFSKIYVLNSDRPYNNLLKYTIICTVSEAKTRITTPGWQLLAEYLGNERQHLPTGRRPRFFKAV